MANDKLAQPLRQTLADEEKTAKEIEKVALDLGKKVGIERHRAIGE